MVWAFIISNSKGVYELPATASDNSSAAIDALQLQLIHSLAPVFNRRLVTGVFQIQQSMTAA